MERDNMRKEVTNLGLASYLSILGYKLIDIRANGRKSVFVFEGNGNIETDSMAFFNKQGKVEPLTFWETMKSLKALAQQG